MILSRNAGISPIEYRATALAGHPGLCGGVFHLGIDVSRHPRGGGNHSAVHDGGFSGAGRGHATLSLVTESRRREAESDSLAGSDRCRRIFVARRERVVELGRAAGAFRGERAADWIRATVDGPAGMALA